MTSNENFNFESFNGYFNVFRTICEKKRDVERKFSVAQNLQENHRPAGFEIIRKLNEKYL